MAQKHRIQLRAVSNVAASKTALIDIPCGARHHSITIQHGYALLSRYVLQGQILLLTLRAAQPHLNAEELGSVVMALPPTRKEQEAIVDFLDTRLADMERLVTGITTQIATLTAYRKSLIHECVTGQRRVTEADLNHVKTHG